MYTVHHPETLYDVGSNMIIVMWTLRLRIRASRWIAAIACRVQLHGMPPELPINKAYMGRMGRNTNRGRCSGFSDLEFGPTSQGSTRSNLRRKTSTLFRAGESQ